MRITSKAAGVGIALVATLALAGCVQPPPVVIPTADPTATPVFKTDADALAAAKTALIAYLEVSDKILQDGGRDPARLTVVATPAKIKSDSVGFAEFIKKQWHSTGTTKVDGISLESYSPSASAGSVVVYACIDVANVDVVDELGNSVVPSTRPARQPVEASFDLSSVSPATLLVASEAPWSGGGVCP